MARYKVLARSYIDNRIYEPGAVIEFGGKPGKSLEPLDAEAKTAAKKVEATDPPAAGAPASDPAAKK